MHKTMVLLFVCIGTSSFLTMTPVDTVATECDRVVFQCRTSFPYPVDWKHTALHSTYPDMLFFGGCVVDAFKQRVTIDNSDAGQYDLAIIKVQKSDAGTYHCIDRAGYGQEVTAKLTVKGI